MFTEGSLQGTRQRVHTSAFSDVKFHQESEASPESDWGETPSSRLYGDSERGQSFLGEKGPLAPRILNFTHAPFPRVDPGSPGAFLNRMWEEWAGNGAQTWKQTAVV